MTIDKKTFLILIAFVLTVCSTTAQTPKSKNPPVPYDKNKKYTVSELQFDLAILKDALLKAHPGLFLHQTEKEFEDNYNKTKGTINRPLTEMEFYNLIAPFISNIKCGHTHLFMSEAFDNYREVNVKSFPFSVRIIEPKIYIKENYTADTTVQIGSEIISINGSSADSILRFMRPHGFGWVDGFTKSYTRIEEFFQTLLLGLFNYPDKYVLNIIDTKGNSRLIECEAIDNKTSEERYLKRYAPNPNLKYQHFKFRVIDSLSTAIIKIDEFEGKDFDKFLASSFETIKTKGIKNLIIDLKGNVGGDGYYPKLLYSYIALNEYKFDNRMETTIDNPKDTIFKYGMLENDVWKYKPIETEKGKYDLTGLPESVLSKKPYKPNKNNFTGNVFVLIDVKSYSGSAEFSAVTHHNKRAKFIGRETGGGYCGNTSGFDFVLTLPKTKLLVPIPLIKSYSAVEGPCGGGVKPDYPLKEDIKDYILNRDSDLLFTLGLIRQLK